MWYKPGTKGCRADGHCWQAIKINPGFVKANTRLSVGCKVALDLKQIMSFGAIFRRENNLGVPNNLSIRPNYMKFEVLVLYIINRDKSRTRKNFWGEKMTDVNK